MKYTLITGASVGIGFDTALKFAKRNKNLILVARNELRLNESRKLILEVNPNIDVVIKEVDLLKSENIFKMYDELKNYHIETLINNAGFGNYGSLAKMDFVTLNNLLDLNIKALVILSKLFIDDYKDVINTQLINVSSHGGYGIGKNAITYCATKFFVSSFTEGLALELIDFPIQVKVLAPAVTKTEFAKTANSVEEYSYEDNFEMFHTSEQMAGFLLDLYDSNKIVGIVNSVDYSFNLVDPIFRNNF